MSSNVVQNDKKTVPILQSSKCGVLRDIIFYGVDYLTFQIFDKLWGQWLRACGTELFSPKFMQLKWSVIFFAVHMKMWSHVKVRKMKCQWGNTTSYPSTKTLKKLGRNMHLKIQFCLYLGTACFFQDIGVIKNPLSLSNSIPSNLKCQ